MYNARSLQRARQHARDRGLPDSATARQFRCTLRHFKHCCAICNRPLTRGATIDHWQPLESGGDSAIGNLVPMCLDCNHDKANQDARLWLTVRYGADEGQRIFERIENYLRQRR